MAFKHPIEYLDITKIHPISPVVCNDLELETMYQIVFKPKHKYAQNMIQQWKTKFTSDVEYLQQTQQLIANCATIESSCINDSDLDCVFEDIFSASGFCDRYSYIDIEHFKHVNENFNVYGFLDSG